MDDVVGKRRVDAVNDIIKKLRTVDADIPDEIFQQLEAVRDDELFPEELLVKILTVVINEGWIGFISPTAVTTLRFTKTLYKLLTGNNVWKPILTTQYTNVVQLFATDVGARARILFEEIAPNWLRQLEERYGLKLADVEYYVWWILYQQILLKAPDVSIGLGLDEEVFDAASDKERGFVNLSVIGHYLNAQEINKQTLEIDTIFTTHIPSNSVFDLNPTVAPVLLNGILWNLNYDGSTLDGYDVDGNSVGSLILDTGGRWITALHDSGIFNALAVSFFDFPTYSYTYLVELPPIEPSTPAEGQRIDVVKDAFQKLSGTEYMLPNRKVLNLDRTEGLFDFVERRVVEAAFGYGSASRFPGNYKRLFFDWSIESKTLVIDISTDTASVRPFIPGYEVVPSDIPALRCVGLSPEYPEDGFLEQRLSFVYTNYAKDGREQTAVRSLLGSLHYITSIEVTKMVIEGETLQGYSARCYDRWNPALYKIRGRNFISNKLLRSFVKAGEDDVSLLCCGCGREGAMKRCTDCKAVYCSEACISK